MHEPAAPGMTTEERAQPSLPRRTLVGQQAHAITTPGSVLQPPPQAHSGGPLASGQRLCSLEWSTELSLPFTHAFPVVRLILTPSSPQGTGHTQPDPGWPDPGWPAEPLRQQHQGR